MEPLTSSLPNHTVKLGGSQPLPFLTCLSEIYGRLCVSVDTSLLYVNEKRLRMLDDSLWTTTQTLCREIEHASQTCDEELVSFRQGEFSKRVMEWFRRHEQTARL